MSFNSANAFRTLSRRFSIRTPVWTRSTTSPQAPTTSGGAARIEATTRGCHRTRTDDVDIQLSFRLAAGATLTDPHFQATLTDPTAWTVVPGVPNLIDRPGSEIFRLSIPHGEPLPATLSFDVTATGTSGGEVSGPAELAVPVGICNAG